GDASDNEGESDREDTLTDPEEIRVSTGLLKKVYAYYKAEKSVAHVKKDALPEELVNFTEARAFFATKCCLNCGQPGHRAKNCNLPRVVICRACDRPGHMSNACDDPYRKKQCTNCGTIGHIKAICPAPKVPTCKNQRLPTRLRILREMGHDVPSCPPTLPEDVLICFVCGKEGHNAQDCPDKPPSKHGPADATKAKADEWGTADASETKATVPGPADASESKATVPGPTDASETKADNWGSWGTAAASKTKADDSSIWGTADASKTKADNWGIWGTADASKAKADDSGSVLGTDNNMNWVNYAAGDSKKMEGNDRPAWMDRMRSSDQNGSRQSYAEKKTLDD
ncbi:MAG: hypothetical protein Q9224_007256, partial [Gallowayella concinna]